MAVAMDTTHTNPNECELYNISPEFIEIKIMTSAPSQRRCVLKGAACPLSSIHSSPVRLSQRYTSTSSIWTGPPLQHVAFCNWLSCLESVHRTIPSFFFLSTGYFLFPKALVLIWRGYVLSGLPSNIPVNPLTSTPKHHLQVWYESVYTARVNCK